MYGAPSHNCDTRHKKREKEGEREREREREKEKELTRVGRGEELRTGAPDFKGLNANYHVERKRGGGGGGLEFRGEPFLGES